jgi:ABC-2 type transport system permease protein
MTYVLLLVWRSLRNSLRTPAALIPNIAISVFFLFVFNSGLSSVAGLPGFKGSYLAFIIPVSIVSASVGGAGSAGQALVRDIESGYFTKLLLTPASRLALIWGPMVAGAVLLVGQVVLILALGLALGLHAATGAAGLAAVLFFAFLWGMAFAFAFFPLIFLSTTFVPKEYITATWLKWAATVNPTTYIYDAMRSLLIDGWVARPLLIGLGVVLAFATITGLLALRQARRSTQLG